jgi:hypothetical protein
MNGELKTTEEKMVGDVQGYYVGINSVNREIY